ncbi:MAG: ATP-dependent DNA helicase [Acidimicrobiales bacterium]|nr:ATP-dependent DNA helicase [Acidimicrobiales bacterium]
MSDTTTPEHLAERPEASAEPRASDTIRGLLATATEALPGGGEDRPGQVEMAEAVGATIESGEHLVVQAGTGTGKSLAYLVPVVVSGERAVVATATKALQDQLANKDLPFLSALVPGGITFAVLKGRSNYVCRQRIAEIESPSDQLGFEGFTDAGDDEQIAELVEWAATTVSGDRAELPFEPSVGAWSAVSVGPRECPGKARCPQGETCFAEQAREQAAAADITVVNSHLYGLHLATDAVLAEHKVAIIDEAHQFEDVLSATLGFELSGGRMRHLVRTTQAILDDADLVIRADEAGDELADALRRYRDQRLSADLPEDLAAALISCRSRADRIHNALRNIPDDAPDDVKNRKLRAVQSVTALIDDLDAMSTLSDEQVAWVEGSEGAPVLKVAPLRVDDVLHEKLWQQRATVLTSATMPTSLPDRLGITSHPHRVLDVGSPFDYENNAMLYCAAHLPDPRDDNYRDALHQELEQLIVAAGGRTLALFTSRRAMLEAADELEPLLPYAVYTQDQLPKAKLIEAFTTDESSCLFATMSFWQGVDIPGPALSLVTIDRLPFPRPDDPLLQARRDLAGNRAFREIDLPRAATLLAQGAGRLIRRSTDHGVVAVFDPRLATKKSYRWDIIKALPPMTRTRDTERVVKFLNAIRSRRDEATATR